ncbi:6-phosphogluconate dehydrogenase [Apodospora peruviana]|uniref:3-hydroxyisobutyrate dehydrogenase n=1 Tax=Apodospora peruviana TaxID=516989 RepID=A0AAE0IR81_9PEZI|nr:6-phosphogluconate dehydrogenase [Apodospora peruviana]
MPSSPDETVAFIGLGVMGYPMAKNLRAGLGPEKTLLICDVNTDALERFKVETEGQGPVEVVKNGFEGTKAAVGIHSLLNSRTYFNMYHRHPANDPCVCNQNTVITMLPGSDAVKTVYLDPETGILAGAIAAVANDQPPAQKLIMECGTIETDTILAVAQTTQKTSSSKLSDALTFVDAPVSGGPMGAQDGTLTFMVGCLPAASPRVFPIVKSYLAHMGNKDGIFLCGDVGAGTAFKIINNYLSAITSLAASEALNIGVKAGLDPSLLTDVINASGGQCWVTSKSNPVPGVQANVPSSRGYEGGFRIELCAKVLGMGKRLAEMVGARTVLDGPTLEAFGEAMADQRYRGKDARVVYKWLNESERR